MVAHFDDGKDEGALRTIGELGEALGIKAHVLRYWEDQFPMLKPLKRSGGRRYYRPGDVALVEEIDRLVNREGYTLRGARAALKDFRADAAVAAATPVMGDTQSVASDDPPAAESHPTVQGLAPASPSLDLAKLRSIRERLAAAIAD